MTTMFCTPGLGPTPMGIAPPIPPLIISKELLSYCDYWIFMWYINGNGDTYKPDEIQVYLEALDKNGVPVTPPTGVLGGKPQTSRLKFESAPLSLIKDKMIFGSGTSYPELIQNNDYVTLINKYFNRSTITWCTKCPEAPYPKGCVQ